MYHFEYTRDLDGIDFVSSWVKDVSYNDRTKELFLVTKNNADKNGWGDAYLYRSVPVGEFDKILNVASGGGSVGRAVDDFMAGMVSTLKYSESEYEFAPIPESTINDTPTKDLAVDKSDLPLAVRTEVQFTLDGDVKFMRSTKTVEETLRDYLTSVDQLGLDATLEAVHVYYA